MRRVWLVVLTVALAFHADARNDHVRPYTEGMAAVERGDWATVVQKMTEAVGFAPQEERSMRTRSGPIPYVPHFWLGIAYANQEQWDAALAELKISESQGVIQNTTNYARLRSTKSKIEGQKATTKSAVGVEEARNHADAALKTAYAAQASATTAGASRQSEFRQANQKLQEAIAARKEGTAAAFERMASAATQAAELYRAAEEKASAQPSGVMVRRRAPVEETSEEVEPPPPEELAPVVESPAVESKPEAEEIPSVRQPATEKESSQPPATSPPASGTTLEAESPALELTVPPEQAIPPTPQASPPVSAPAESPVDTQAALSASYRLMARGELRDSSSMLSSLIIANPRSVDALVLRGYVRYLQGVLERKENLLQAAEQDFRAALKLNPRIVLDEKSFSPKAVRFFDTLRQSKN